jgi:type II secretory pathway pseudopilin PulG
MQLSPPMRAREARGFALIDLLFVIAIIGMLSAIATPGLMRARASANAASALGTLRVINSAEISYAITCGVGFYAPDLVTLGTPPPGSVGGFVSDDLGAANVVIKSNYQVEVAAAGSPGSPASCNGLGIGQGGTGYRARADSIDPTLSQFYATNASGGIYVSDVALFAAMPEAGPPPIGTAIH